MSRRTSNTTSAPEPEAAATGAAADTPEQEPAVYVGRLTRDPELRHTHRGTPVCNLRIAINRPGEDSLFRTCVCWSRTAEVVAEYLRKGRLVEVTGVERTRAWTGRDGEERTDVEITAYRVQFVRGQAPEASAA
jgi:single-strand DNA-binding protein